MNQKKLKELLEDSALTGETLSQSKTTPQSTIPFPGTLSPEPPKAHGGYSLEGPNDSSEEEEEEEGLNDRSKGSKKGSMEGASAKGRIHSLSQREDPLTQGKEHPVAQPNEQKKKKKQRKKKNRKTETPEVDNAKGEELDNEVPGADRFGENLNLPALRLSTKQKANPSLRKK